MSNTFEMPDVFKFDIGLYFPANKTSEAELPVPELTITD